MGSFDSRSTIVSVIDDFNYSTQDSVYNEDFKNWRRDSDNQYTFSYKANKLESVYVTGKGFIEHSQVEAEKSIISHIFNMLGIAALMFIVMELAVDKLLIMFMEQFGFNIYYNFFDSSIIGGQKEILFVLLLCGTLKFLVPAAYISSKLKMPPKVAVMRKLHDSIALIGSISTALIVTTAFRIPIAYSSESKEIYEFFTALNVNIAVWEQKEFLIYTVFDVIMIPIMTEFLFRGAIFSALRQFGDPFAIVMSALTSSLLVQDISQFPAAFCISLVAGYGLSTTGTIFTPLAVHIIYKMYDLALTVIELDTTDIMPLTRNLFMMTALIIGSMGLAVYWASVVRKKKENLAFYHSEFSYKNRVIFSLRTFPYSAVVIVCIVRGFIKMIMTRLVS